MSMLSVDPGAPTPADAVFARDSARLLERSLGAVNGAVRLRLDEPNAPNEAVIVPAAARTLRTWCWMAASSASRAGASGRT